ncbi:MAG: hypothetical protein GPOALKHO_000215 [Sodalis sp.]|nr:MAG: hypothetical protein GPOALKHO_000215 [Sodalis sp.]
MNGRIAELLEHQRALGIGRDNFFRLSNGAFHPLWAVWQHQFGAQPFKGLRRSCSSFQA